MAACVCPTNIDLIVNNPPLTSKNNLRLVFQESHDIIHFGEFFFSSLPNAALNLHVQ